MSRHGESSGSTMTPYSRGALLLLHAILPLLATMAAANDAPEPLWLAIRDGKSPHRFQRWLETGADPLLSNVDGDSAVHLAAASPNLEYLRLLLARGISPDTPNTITGRTPLFTALIYERDSQFAMLLAAGANPGSADRMGNTPLHIAAQINNSLRVLDLLEAGAPPKALNRQGQTFQRYLFMTPDRLLTAGARHARQEVTRWLLAHDIAPETTGQTQ